MLTRLTTNAAVTPDFNPIEPAFGKVKAPLRWTGARSFDALVAALGAALGEAIDTATADDARGFYAHCGFPLPDQL